MLILDPGMDTHRKQIVETIHLSSSKTNIDHSCIIFRVNHKRVRLPSLISILTMAVIPSLIIAIAIATILKIDHRTIMSQDSQTLIRLSLTLNHMLPHSLSSQVASRRGRHFRMYRACHPNITLNIFTGLIGEQRTTTIGDAVIHNDQTQGYYELLAPHASHRTRHPPTHPIYAAECSKFQ